MVIGISLAPLEFTDCLLDTPDFRENLNRHEKELEKTSQQIKRIIKEVKDLLSAAKNLSRAQRTLSKSLGEFNFECIGSTQTDDEQVIADSLKQFGKLISAIEDERDNMLDRAHDQIVVPLEEFRKNHIGGVKENKKKYDKKTAKFCSAQERSLNMSAKKPGTIEADASLGMLERQYLHESLSYVLRIQEVQERIKFEFVETLLGFMSGWLVFYHLGHELSEDAKEYMTDLQHKVQKTRENFDNTRSQAEALKSKYMDSKMKPETEYTKQGYLFLMEKSKLKAFTATWSKYYCTYKKTTKQFTMLQYNQMSAKVQTSPEKLTLASCTRRVSEFEKRFCFDLTFDEKVGQTLTLQALSEEDRKAWLSAMDGKEPTYLVPGQVIKSDESSNLDEVGFAFVNKCIEVLEGRGLEEEGLYRVGGVGTKIMKLINMGLDRKKTEQERFTFFYDEQYSDVLESKTVASALKHYLRHLNEPLMTFRYHKGFIAAAKQETRMQRISDVHTLIYRLPKSHHEMLDIVIKHLKNVSQKSNKNKMSVFNLGVVFGPTLLRAEEETLAAILDIKFNNVVIEILIENYELIFKNPPGPPSEYLSHSTSPPVPSQRSSSNYHRNPLYSQPVVRVVAKSNYTDPVMSSSLQNIPNGIYVYNQTNGNGKLNFNTKTNHHHPIYDQKSASASSSINHSTSSLLMNNQQQNSSSTRDIHLVGLRTGTTPDNSTTYGGQVPTTNNGHNNSSPPSHHYSQRDQQQPIYQQSNHSANNREQRTMMLSGGRESNSHSRETNLSSISRSTGGEGIYGPGMRLNHPMTTSDTNLSNSRKELSLINDRLHSTSSSNESVCSSSSRDLNHSGSPYTQSGGHLRNKTQTTSSQPLVVNQNQNSNSWEAYHGNVIGPPVSYSPSLLREENTIPISQTYIPKKTQRGHKDILLNRYPALRNNLRVRTLYACLAENDGELSFEPNQIITNVRPSNEPGWLDGTLNGKSGLIPENYVEILP